MKINVGCGDDLKPDCVNVDFRPGVGDVTANMDDLPFPDGSVEQVFALDVLEHVPREQGRAALAEWYRVLAPGGRLVLRVPNMQGLATHLLFWHDKPGTQLDTVLENIYGGRKWETGDQHHWGYTPATIRLALEEAGFVFLGSNEAVNMTVTASKP